MYRAPSRSSTDSQVSLSMTRSRTRSSCWHCSGGDRRQHPVSDNQKLKTLGKCDEGTGRHISLSRTRWYSLSIFSTQLRKSYLRRNNKSAPSATKMSARLIECRVPFIRVLSGAYHIAGCVSVRVGGVGV